MRFDTESGLTHRNRHTHRAFIVNLSIVHVTILNYWMSRLLFLTESAEL